jgi:uncharacterized protein (DUF3084 family)
VTEADLLRWLDQTIQHNSEVIERADHLIDLNGRAFQRLVTAQTRLERTVARLDRTVDDLRDQIAANTEALRRLIDRLGPAPNGG